MRRIEAFAVVCEAGCLCDAQGRMPDALKSEAEWRFFQAGLDRADVTVLGRLSHEAAPNPRRRRRLVMTSRVDAVEPVDPETGFWNPAGASLDAALGVIATRDADLAVAGGAGVFDWFLSGPFRCTTFYLSRMAGVALTDGRGVFTGVGPGRSPEAILAAAGYSPGATIRLDARASVTPWTILGHEDIENR